jgi:hypothetical protein
MNLPSTFVGKVFPLGGTKIHCFTTEPRRKTTSPETPSGRLFAENLRFGQRKQHKSGGEESWVPRQGQGTREDLFPEEFFPAKTCKANQTRAEKEHGCWFGNRLMHEIVLIPRNRNCAIWSNCRVDCESPITARGRECTGIRSPDSDCFIRVAVAGQKSAVG